MEKEFTNIKPFIKIPKKDIDSVSGCIKPDESWRLAEDHWKFIEKWLHMVYVDSFVHGYKHGVESKDEKMAT